MKMMCAWCGSQIADRPHLDAVAKYPITHGICRVCRDRLLPTDRTQPLERYLDSLELPVMLITDQSNVAFANAQALAFLDKTPEQVVGYRGGNVMECVYAKLPEGCGQTEHCVACTVRRNVMHTFETGESLDHVPASINRQSRHGMITVDFLISTEKIGDIVMLRIDKIAEGA